MNHTRLAFPDLDQKEQLHQTGIGIINLFASDFFNFLNDQLLKEHPDWLNEYRQSSMAYRNYNFDDPGNLLKEIIRVSTSPLRIPIRNGVPKKDLVSFFSRLEIILDDRNDWVHRNQEFTKESLKSVILNLLPVAKLFQLEVNSEARTIIALLENVVPETNSEQELADKVSVQAESLESVGKIRKTISQDEPQVGTTINEKFLEASYVLHISGEIRDRKSGKLLSEYHPEEANRIGTVLISRKPSGGRLRLTGDGIIAAYFEDHWGYLGKVQLHDWFPVE
jgi:hypothetical protein